jgi:hypothetical protein
MVETAVERLDAIYGKELMVAETSGILDETNSDENIRA